MTLTAEQKLELIEFMSSNGQLDSTIEGKQRAIDDIYMVVHPSTDCPHPQWQKNSYEFYQQLKKNGTL